MANRKPSWLLWITAVLIGVPALYVASFGPACWMADFANGRHDYFLREVYRPLLVAARDYPKSVGYIVNWYASVGREDGYAVYLQPDGVEMRMYSRQR